MISVLGSQCPTSRKIYEDTNEQIEKQCKLAHLFIAKVTPVSIITPKVLASFFIYFSTNLSNDSFELPFPMW